MSGRVFKIVDQTFAVEDAQPKRTSSEERGHFGRMIAGAGRRTLSNGGVEIGKIRLPLAKAGNFRSRHGKAFPT